MPGSSRLSREFLTIGAVFYYRDFEGHTETKDRYFIVVGANETQFFCFTTSTSQRLIDNPYLASQVTPIIPRGCECFRKSCVVDCTELVAFDDIQISNYLNSRRVTLEGMLSDERLRWIAQTVKKSVVLNARERRVVQDALAQYWEQSEAPPEE
jgi:hypothetical protein